MVNKTARLLNSMRARPQPLQPIGTELFMPNYSGVKDVVRKTSSETIWASNNDGVGSGMDADLLDGQHGTYFLDSGNFTGTNWTDLTDAGQTTLHKHDHGLMDGVADDDHTQYALLLGRAGGQVLIGGTGAGDDLTLKSTSNATKGTVFFGTLSAYDEVNDRFGIGTTTPNAPLHITKPPVATGAGFNAIYYIAPTSVAHNDRIYACEFGTAPAGATIYTALNRGSTTGTLAAHYGNTGLGYTMFVLSGTNGGGDIMFRFDVSGIIQWYCGLDNSASDRFVIGAGAVPGTADGIRIESTGAVALPYWTSVGTATDSTTTGDFSSGLTGAARLFYDQSTATLNFYNASNVLKIVIDAANSIIDLSNITAGSANLKINATTDVPTATWGVGVGNEVSTAPAGWMEITVGAVSRYIPYWA